MEYSDPVLYPQRKQALDDAINGVVMPIGKQALDLAEVQFTDPPAACLDSAHGLHFVSGDGITVACNPVRCYGRGIA